MNPTRVLVDDDQQIAYPPKQVRTAALALSAFLLVGVLTA